MTSQSTTPVKSTDLEVIRFVLPVRLARSARRNHSPVFGRASRLHGPRQYATADTRPEAVPGCERTSCLAGRRGLDRTGDDLVAP